MAQDLMNYEQMTQLALRGVVRDAIRRVIREDGLPGAHHFYITFLTGYPGAEIDESLAKKYPEEITIVIEHQYWDLAANPDNFEVTLKFGGVPKYLKVPYTAITRFHDPSVGFALQFEPPKPVDDMSEAPLTRLQPKKTPALKKVKSAAKAKSDKANAPAQKPASPKAKPNMAKSTSQKAKNATKKPATAKKSNSKKDAIKPAVTKKDAENKDGDKVVSLDAFRKK